MRGVAFVNHLRLGSASSFRQAGLAKYLDRLAVEGEFLGLRGNTTAKAAETMEEWRCFRRISYWNEPIVNRFLENLGLFKRVAHENPVLHVNRANPYTATIASLGKSGGNKLVVDMEDWDGFGGYSSYANLYGGRGALLTLYENAFPRLGDLVLTVSHLLTSRMAQLGVSREKILLIPNGYDEELFDSSMSGDEVRDQYGLRGSPVVIYMSTFHKFERGLHEIALSAFKEVTRQVPDAKLLMLGGGNLPISSLIAERGLEKRVVRNGFRRTEKGSRADSLSRRSSPRDKRPPLPCGKLPHGHAGVHGDGKADCGSEDGRARLRLDGRGRLASRRR